MAADSSIEQARRALVGKIMQMGYPREFGTLIADNLGTEKAMRRMISYLYQGKPHSAEEITDEMLAIVDMRSRWVEHKQSEYYNWKYYQLRRNNFERDDIDLDDPDYPDRPE